MFLSESGSTRNDGINFQHHVILIQLGEHDRHQPLSEGVIQRVVNGAGSHSQARGGVAVDDHIDLRRLVLLIGGHIAQLRKRLQLRHQPAVQTFNSSGSASSS